MHQTRCSGNSHLASNEPPPTARKIMDYLRLCRKCMRIVPRPLPQPWQAKNVSQSFGIMVCYKSPEFWLIAHSICITENCPPAAGSSGAQVVDNISHIAHEFGAITVFKAYLELGQTVSIKIQTLRSQLHSSGVSLIDCPHNSRKEVADKMLLGAHICVIYQASANSLRYSGHDGARHRSSCTRHYCADFR